MTPPEISRAEHMAWCKQRALRYPDDGNLVDAFASFASDIQKHPDTATPAVVLLTATIGMRCAIDRDAPGLRRFIEGFAE